MNALFVLVANYIEVDLKNRVQNRPRTEAEKESESTDYLSNAGGQLEKDAD